MNATSWNGTNARRKTGEACVDFEPLTFVLKSLQAERLCLINGGSWIKQYLFGKPQSLYLLRSECFRCEFFNSFLTRLDRECSFWKIVLKSCSWKRVSRMPSRITMPRRLFKTGCWSMSKSMVIPDREVSEPMTRRRSSEKLENKAALATMRVRILVFSSLGCLAAAGYL